MHAVTTSPGDLFFGTAARDATKSVLSVCYKEKKGLRGFEWVSFARFAPWKRCVRGTKLLFVHAETRGRGGLRLGRCAFHTIPMGAAACIVLPPRPPRLRVKNIPPTRTREDSLREGLRGCCRLFFCAPGERNDPRLGIPDEAANSAGRSESRETVRVT